MTDKQPNLPPLPTRDECRHGPRPCPHARCRYHLGYNINSQGKLKEVAGWKKRGSCCLDYAEIGVSMTHAQVGQHIGVTHERCRQLEVRALHELHTQLVKRGLTKAQVQDALDGLHRDNPFETRVNTRRHWNGQSLSVDAKCIDEVKEDMARVPIKERKRLA